METKRVARRKHSAQFRAEVLQTCRQADASVAAQAGVINQAQDLSAIRVGLHDEIFQGSVPVLAGVDAASTHCYLLEAAQQRDSNTWAIYLLDACKQGFNPDHTIADAGQGLRAGQQVALPGTLCHGDVFHIQKQCKSLANVLARRAKGAVSRCRALEQEMARAKELGLLQFFLNHRTFARSRCPERVGKSLAQLLTGNTHPHWLELLGFTRFQRA